MRQASKRVPDSAEKTVRDIRRAVCRQNISDGWLGNLRECLAHLV